MMAVMRSYQRSTGFSLVELLVASSILLLVLFIGSYGYGLFARYWNEEVGKFDAEFHEVRNLNILYQVFKSSHPYLLKTTDGNAYHYFNGGKSVIRAFNARSLFFEGKMSFYELKVEETGDGLQQLIYREWPVMRQPVIFEGDIESYTRSIVLLDNIVDLSFEYFGWSSYTQWAERNLLQRPASPEWYGFYSGKDTLLPPNLIKVTIQKNDELSVFEVALPQFSNEQMKRYFKGNADA